MRQVRSHGAARSSGSTLHSMRNERSGDSIVVTLSPSADGAASWTIAPQARTRSTMRSRCGCAHGGARSTHQRPRGIQTDAGAVAAEQWNSTDCSSAPW